MSMAAKSSNLVDETSGANLQMEDHVDVPAQSAKNLWEPEALDSPPSHSPSWSPAQRPQSGCPNMKYLFGDTCDFNGRIGDNTPTLSLLDGSPCGRYAAQC